MAIGKTTRTYHKIWHASLKPIFVVLGICSLDYNINDECGPFQIFDMSCIDQRWIALRAYKSRGGRSE
jgi:hypothetical protein